MTKSENEFAQMALSAMENCGWSAPSGALGTIEVHSAVNGALLPSVTGDNEKDLMQKIASLKEAQQQWSALPRATREAFLKHYAAIIREHAEALKILVVLDAGKTNAEAAGEVAGSASVLENTITQAAKLEPGEAFSRPPLGVVGLITSYNFPLAVAHWTIAPALLAGNAVLWKPSEKTLLVAVAIQSLFAKAAQSFTQGKVPAGLLQTLIAGRDVAQHMIASDKVAVISATGSVGMGKAINGILGKRAVKAAPSILELGGNNPVIISGSLNDAELETALKAVLFSAVASSGQRCTDTRRLIIHERHYDAALAWLKEQEQGIIDRGAVASPVELGDAREAYGPLIDASAYRGYVSALERAVAEDATLNIGTQTFTSMPPESAYRLYADRWPEAYYVKPVLVEAEQKSGGLLHDETFAPVLFLLRYSGFENALALANAPANAGLVQGLYTSKREEADAFAKHCMAGHGVINSPTGTGTPAGGLGFGGCRDSGEGEILGLDPLAPFSRGASLAELPSPEQPQQVTEGGVEKRKYIITRADGARTRIVENNLIEIR